MRRLTRFIATLLLILMPAGALAAPTCQTRDGDVIKCGVSGAMPVGWTLPPEEYAAHHPDAENTDPNQLLKAIGLVALMLTFILALPDFDGRNDRDWIKQDKDDRRR
ncbi:MAG TPA: hypothetical protein VHL34_23965 [Rhizomicrobium sp.]|jgi:hypothetical protein|nr:hypothetical protein [Rhizomicrobium sp.]